eukprot:gene48979-51063_t
MGPLHRSGRGYADFVALLHAAPQLRHIPPLPSPAGEGVRWSAALPPLSLIELREMY